MQSKQKYVIVLSGFVVFLFLGYIAIQHPDSSPVDVIKTNNPISQSGIETDTGKRLETLANSGTSWGMSPFGSGKPLEAEKLEFKKPNTEWKTRTLSGITYVFGEGNPEGKKLSESDIHGCSYQEAGIEECTDNGDGYVDGELERAIQDMFNLPNWNQILTHCKQQFQDTDSRVAPARFDFQDSIDFAVLHDLSSYVSMDEIIQVNPKTGRKNMTKIGTMKLMNLLAYIYSATWHGHNFDTIEPDYSKCVDTYGTPIINSLLNIRSLPWRGSLLKNESSIDPLTGYVQLIPLDQPLGQ